MRAALEEMWFPLERLGHTVNKGFVEISRDGARIEQDLFGVDATDDGWGALSQARRESARASAYR